MFYTLNSQNFIYQLYLNEAGTHYTRSAHKNQLHWYILAMHVGNWNLKHSNTTASTMVKYVGMNLRKHVQDLNVENYKALVEEIKEDLNKWREILCSWIEGSTH